MRRLVSVLLFLCAATGVISYSVTTTNANVKVKENAGVDLTCTYSADFGSNPRIEWKFKDRRGSQTYVVYNGQPTALYTNRVTLYSSSNLRFSKVTRDDNGEYTCEVSSSQSNQQVVVTLIVLVPPTVPMCSVPPTVTTGTLALLMCHDPAASPPPTHNWYKDGTLLPADPSKVAGFQNATYKLDAKTGKLEFPSAAKRDSGQYYCEVVNEAGPAQRCQALKMEVRDLNTGGIVAGVIIFLLLLVVAILGIWYAKKKGYLPKKTESKKTSTAVYQPPSMYAAGGGNDDGEFKQKSSFVV